MSGTGRLCLAFLGAGLFVGAVRSVVFYVLVVTTQFWRHPHSGPFVPHQRANGASPCPQARGDQPMLEIAGCRVL